MLPHKWIAGEKLEHEQFHPQVQRALDHAVKPLRRYRCAACGFDAISTIGNARAARLGTATQPDGLKNYRVPTSHRHLKTISKEIMQAKVLVVGDAMLDRYWYGAVDRISPEAPVPVVRVTREEERIGAAANVAYNVVTMGAQASLLTVVGDDEASHKLEALVATPASHPTLAAMQI